MSGHHASCMKIEAVSEWIKCCKQFAKEYETLCESSDKQLYKLLNCDELLNDIPYDITQEEIVSKVKIEFRLIESFC